MGTDSPVWPSSGQKLQFPEANRSEMNSESAPVSLMGPWEYDDLTIIWRKR